MPLFSTFALDRWAGFLAICVWIQACGMAADKANSNRHEPTVSPAEAKTIGEAEAMFDADPESAIQSLRTQLTADASAAVDFALAALLARKGDFTAAAFSLEAAVKKHPAFTRAWLLLGRVRLLDGNAREAIHPFRKALALGAKADEVYELLAGAHLQSDQPAAAASAYRQVLALRGEDRETLAGLARALILQSRHAEAASLVRKLSRETPQKCDLWRLRAGHAMDQGKNRQAIVLLECANRLNAGEPVAPTALGDLYFNEGLYAKATDQYRLAYSKNKIDPERVLRFAEALIHAGESKHAETLLKEIPEQRQPVRGKYLRARIAAENKEWVTATGLLFAYLSDNPLDGDALLFLADLQQQQEHDEKALLTLERATRIEEARHRALLQRARIHVKRGEYAQAVAHLENAQTLSYRRDVEKYLSQVRQAAASVDG